jgi:hypothetical protein
MHVIIVVMALAAIIFAQRITNGVIRRWYGVNDALFHKRLQCAVHRYTVKFFTASFLDIRMRESAAAMQKKFKNRFSAIGNTQLVLPEYVIYLYGSICVGMHDHSFNW